MPERVLLVENDLVNHIDTDDKRWGFLARLVILGGSGALTVICSVVGWAFITIHDDQQRQMDVLQQRLPPAHTASPRS